MLDRKVRGKKLNGEVVLVTDFHSQINVAYKSSNCITLIDTQEASRVTSVKDQGNVDDGLSIDSDVQEDEPAEDGAWDFHDLRGSGHLGVPDLQAVRDLCTGYNIK